MKKLMRTQEEIDRIALLKKLPNIARMIRNLLTQEKKAALTLDFVCRKLRDGIKPKTEKHKIEEDLRAMVVETTGWLSIQVVGSAEYVKVGKTDINKVCLKLETKLKELED